jgi:hypothetical protein
MHFEIVLNKFDWIKRLNCKESEDTICSFEPSTFFLYRFRYDSPLFVKSLCLMLISVLGHSLMKKSCFFHRSKVRYKPHTLIIPKLIFCNTTLTSLKNRINHEQYSYLWNKKFDDICWNMDCDIWRPQYRTANYVCIFDLVSQLWRNWWLQFIAAIICFTWVVYWSHWLMARYSSQPGMKSKKPLFVKEFVSPLPK